MRCANRNHFSSANIDYTKQQEPYQPNIPVIQEAAPMPTEWKNKPVALPKPKASRFQKKR